MAQIYKAKPTEEETSEKADKYERTVEWKVVRQVLPYLMMYPKRLLLVSLLLIAGRVASVSTPLIMREIIDTLGSPTQKLIVSIVSLVLFYGLVNFLSTFLDYLRDFSFAKVSERTRTRITLLVFKHLHQLSLEYHLSRNTGGLSQDISRGTNAIGFLLRFLLFRSVPNIISIVLALGILIGLYDWVYAMIIFLSMALYIAYSFLVTEWQNKYQRIANSLDSASNSRAIDSLLNYETVKYFNNEHHEYCVYQAKLEEWEGARLKSRFSTMVLNSGQSLIIALSVSSLLLLAALRVQSEGLSIGDLVLIHSYIIQLFVPLGFLGYVYMETKNALAAISRMMKIMELESDVQDQAGAVEIDLTKDIPNLAGSANFIKFDSVHFQYNSDRKILDSLSFAIQYNHKIGIVGNTGSGKTTLAKLLFRFYDPQSGIISINGQDIKTISQDSLRKIIGFVPQDTVLFNDTIYYNLQYGNPEASKERILEAIKIAELEDFIASLPKGLETMVGERGLKLSGGEKQRVAIARVILKRPQIIVFDEATSALDSKTEKNIVASFNRIAKDHTSLIIAHRLSTIVDTDKILVLDQGKLVEQGTHQELLFQGGIYKQLWVYQQQHENKNGTHAGGT